MSMEILTPLNKCERVTRKKGSSFVAEPGIWAAVQSDGSVDNIVVTEATPLNKLVMTSASSNVYESHDVEVGRITCMESHGIRIKVDSEGFAEAPAAGEFLLVSSKTGQLGKLVPVTGETETAGVHEVVARCEEIDTVAGAWIVYRTISPYTMTAS